MKFTHHSPRTPHFPKIWLDGRNVGRPGGTGVHHYAINHQTALKQAGFETAWLLENTEYTSPRPSIYRFFQALLSQAPRISEVIQSPWGPAHLARDLYRIAHVHYRYHKSILKLCPSSPPDIMHWTYPLPILIEGCRNIVTIHDLIPLTHPKLTGINPIRFRQLISDLIKHDVYFVTVSETVREQMLSLFPVTPDRVTTLYQPVEFSVEIRKAIQEAPQIAPPNSFIFYGRVESRKNIDRLLEAHALSQTDTPLVIIGPDGDDHPDCSPRSPTSKIIRLPWSHRLSLLRTLSEAKALLFPSLAEGFGLPIAESMALGVPVLTSRGGVTEEIARGASLLCNANDVQDIANKISCLNDNNLRKNEINKIKNNEKIDIFSLEKYKTRIKEYYFNIT